MKTDQIKKGSVLSETSFYVVKDVKPTEVIVKDEFGNEVKIGKPYVEKVLCSADYWESEEKKTMTELADIFIHSPRIAMTVAFYKKDTPKTKKDFEAEKAAKVKEIQNASLATASKLIEDLIEHPLSKVIPGQLRVMKGRHYGHLDDLGRVHFIDMELDKESDKDYDTRKREVDPRTIQWLIVNKVKYTLK
jgi:hypothetical protein